jgi:hypothetical protein
MDSRVTHPSKEQVRAYMMAREHARQPPPTPEEIRRQLGWRLAPADRDSDFVGLCLLPATFGQWAAQLAVDWCLAPLFAQHSPRASPNKSGA